MKTIAEIIRNSELKKKNGRDLTKNKRELPPCGFLVWSKRMRFSPNINISSHHSATFSYMIIIKPIFSSTESSDEETKQVEEQTTSRANQ